MDNESTNPYSPPKAVSEPPRGIDAIPPQWGFAMLVVVAIAYHSFVLLLFLSPPDRHVSIWFLANTPVLAVWLYCLHQKRTSAAIFGIIASVVQLVIGLAMLLLLDHADVVAVISICGVIIAVFLALAYYCHHYSYSDHQAATR